LAIAAEIASAHGGLAYAAPASPSDPQGLRITLALPVDGRPHGDPDPARELAGSLT
jgi:signal transduction histidine kinase